MCTARRPRTDCTLSRRQAPSAPVTAADSGAAHSSERCDAAEPSALHAAARAAATESPGRVKEKKGAQETHMWYNG